ncbi:unnamed protein product [Clonostachys chloroleuca]|uniref:Gfd2/YDR514C-like C-terminal domain-containing protein n=1 Tax=Clonostachys chloroleuca TaxID=1926264 RepID=A0AA35MEK2_9HYPO|nr:unnamed protein product [Clonostachys chloroleuca]
MVPSPMNPSSEGTTTNSLHASLLKGSHPEHSLPPHKSNPPMGPSLRAIGEERRDLGNIRALFGYYPKGKRYIDNKTLREKSHLRDVLFLSVHICPSRIKHQGYVDVGISVFDTRYLDNGMRAGRQDEEWAMAAVQSYHFCLISSNKWGVTLPNTTFNFGRSTVVIPELLPACIADIVRGRDYAVVVSNSHSRPESLRKLGLDLGLDPLCSVDVVGAYNLVMEKHHAGLSNIMSEMCLFQMWTNHPGNAAHYNLRALIGVATLDAAKKEWEWSTDFMWYMTFLAKSPEAMFTEGCREEWVDWFFKAHLKTVECRDVAAHREVEARTWDAKTI